MAGATRTEFLEADIETVSRRDPRWNGALWGLGVGAGLGFLLDASLVNEYGRDDISPGASAAFIASAAAIGAGAGFAIDALIKRRQVIYSRPPASTRTNVTILPLSTGRRTGIVVSLPVG
jgi:hypothetical protein